MKFVSTRSLSRDYILDASGPSRVASTRQAGFLTLGLALAIVVGLALLFCLVFYNPVLKGGTVVRLEIKRVNPWLKHIGVFGRAMKVQFSATIANCGNLLLAERENLYGQRSRQARADNSDTLKISELSHRFANEVIPFYRFTSVGDAREPGEPDIYGRSGATVNNLYVDDVSVSKFHDWQMHQALNREPRSSDVYDRGNLIPRRDGERMRIRAGCFHLRKLAGHGAPLDEGKCCECAGEKNEEEVKPPLRRRAIVVGASFAVWACCLATYGMATSKRIRAIAFAAGLSAALVGTAFGALTCFRWSWGWWL
jgi:hypothetical protein